MFTHSKYFKILHNTVYPKSPNPYYIFFNKLQICNLLLLFVCRFVYIIIVRFALGKFYITKGSFLKF